MINKMKLNNKFLLHSEGSETVLVPTLDAGFSGVLRGNKTLGTILELLKTETTEEKIITELKERFDAPQGAVEKDVKKAVAELRKIGAIDD